MVPNDVILSNTEFRHSVYLFVLCVAYYCHSKYRILATVVIRLWSPVVVTTVTSNDCGSFWVRLPQDLSEATPKIEIKSVLT